MKDMRQVKRALCDLIDNEKPDWTCTFTTIVKNYTYIPNKDIFLGYILLLVEVGKHVQAKALVRSTIDDVALRPWVYQLVLFLAYPFHLAQYLYRRLVS